MIFPKNLIKKKLMFFLHEKYCSDNFLHDLNVYTVNTIIFIKRYFLKIGQGQFSWFVKGNHYHDSVMFQQLDGVGPVDNRPTDKLHPSSKKNRFWHVTRDMWQVTVDTWHMTWDTCHVTCDMLWGVIILSTFQLQCF